MITPTRILLLVTIIALPLLLAGSASAAPSKVARVANAELKKGVVENNGNNVPRYRSGRGAIAPYAIPGGGGWSMTFASWVLQKAGYKGHLRRTGKITIHSGQQAVGYTGAMTDAARRAGKIRQRPRVGYLAMYGDRHVEIVVGTRGRTLVTVGGNTADGVTRVIGASGITHYIAPW